MSEAFRKACRIDVFSAGLGTGHYGEMTITHEPTGKRAKRAFRYPESQHTVRDALFEDLWFQVEPEPEEQCSDCGAVILGCHACEGRPE